MTIGDTSIDRANDTAVQSRYVQRPTNGAIRHAIANTNPPTPTNSAGFAFPISSRIPAKTIASTINVFAKYLISACPGRQFIFASMN